MNENIKVDTSSNKSNQTTEEIGGADLGATTNETKQSTGDFAYRDDSQFLGQLASNDKCDSEKLPTRSLSLESINSSVNEPENEDSSFRAKSEQDKKEANKALKNGRQGTDSRILKSVKFDSAQLEGTERLFIKVHDETRFSRDRGSNGVPKFTPNSKLSPFKCNCLKLERRAGYADQPTCCPKHCPSRNFRQRRSSGYSNVGERSSSRSSNSDERGEYSRPSLSMSNHVNRNSNGRSRNSLDYQYSSWSRISRPANSSSRQYYRPFEHGNNEIHYQSNKQLLMPIYKSNLNEYTVFAHSDDVSDESLNRAQNDRLKFFKRSKGNWAPETENQINRAEDFYANFEEMLTEFSAWNSSLTDDEAHQKSSEFISLAKPLLVSSFLVLSQWT